MTAPYIPTGLQLHASGTVELFTPQIINAVNISSIASGGVGIMDIFMATEIDPVQRIVLISPIEIGGAAIFAQLDAFGVASPSSFRVRCYAAGGGLSNVTGFSFAVVRVQVPG